jgi:type IV secretory pathway TrbL component
MRIGGRFIIFSAPYAVEYRCADLYYGLVRVLHLLGCYFPSSTTLLIIVSRSNFAHAARAAAHAARAAASAARAAAHAAASAARAAAHAASAASRAAHAAHSAAHAARSAASAAASRAAHAARAERSEPSSQALAHFTKDGAEYCFRAQ